MATQAGLVQDGFDRVQAQVLTTVRRLDRELRRVRREVESRRKRFEKELGARRRALRKRAERRVTRLQTRLRKAPLVKRADGLRDDAVRRFESWIEALPIATKRDVERIDRKVSQMNRKLRELEKTQGGTPSKTTRAAEA